MSTHTATWWCRGRKNRNLAKVHVSMLQARNVRGTYWAKWRNTATNVARLPKARVEFKTSFELLWNMKPMVGHFRVFSCVYYVFISNHMRNKFDIKATRYIFVGCDIERKGWRCCDPMIDQCTWSRNNIFDEATSWSSSSTMKKVKDKLHKEHWE